MDTESLVTAVDDAFARTGATTPPWPDPHPDRAALDEEYSRCLEPAKYRILGARMQAWLEALTGVGLATVEPVTDVHGVWQTAPVLAADSTIRLRPAPTEAVPLLVGVGTMDGVPRTTVHVGAGEPAVPMVQLPDCGCDACDSGSDDLLGELDREILQVVTGSLVHVTTPEGAVRTTDAGTSWSGHYSSRKADAMLEQARNGTCAFPVVHGRPWW